MLNIAFDELIEESDTQFLKVRLFVYLTRKFGSSPPDPNTLELDVLNVFQSEDALPLIEEWQTHLDANCERG